MSIARFHKPPTPVKSTPVREQQERVKTILTDVIQKKKELQSVQERKSSVEQRLKTLKEEVHKVLQQVDKTAVIYCNKDSEKCAVVARERNVKVRLLPGDV